MKKTFCILLMFTGFLSCIAQNGVINGKIIPEIPEEKALIAEKTKVILRIGNEEKSIIVDENLSFTFKNINSDSIRIRTEPDYFGQERTVFGFIKPNDTINIELPLALSCKYDRSVNNKTCPVCKKEDLVFPISYGLTAEITKKGELKKDKEYKSGGCVTTGCDPHWYCKRDEIEF